VRRKLDQRLPAESTGRGRDFGFGHDDHGGKLLAARIDRCTERIALRTAPGRERGVLHVAACVRGAIRGKQRRPDAKPGVGGVGTPHRSFGEGAKLFSPGAVHLPERRGRKERPVPRKARPSQSATVAPRSAKVSRRPIATGCTRGPNARTGTFSRAWSVD